MIKAIVNAAALVVLALFTGCGPGNTIDLNSKNIDFDLAPKETPVGWGQKDIEKKIGEAQWVLAPAKNYEIAGLLTGTSQTSKPDTEILAVAFGIVWGKPAIELALQAGKKPDMEKLSVEAKQVLQKYGCAAPYLNQRTVAFTAIGASEEIDAALREAREGCGIYLKGVFGKVKSAKFKGMNINFPASLNVLYVTELRVNEKTYRAP
jgi:hypothetical protein